MGDSQLSAATTVSDGIRSVFAFLDKPAYWLLGIVYELFFNVASADIFANGTVMKFYGRVQLILGVFMMFQLALTILKGIVNPDTITDSKSGAGINGLVSRLAVALIMLTLLVPFETSRSNEYENQISNNGILFGTLYSLQHRLLANNTIGRLILGTNGTDGNYFSDDSATASEQLKTSARIFSSTILKGFYRINLLPEDSRPKHEDGKDDAIFNDNRVCQDIDDTVLAAYTKVDADPGEIIGMVNVTCSGNASGLSLLQKAINVFDPKLAGNSYYVFAYNGLISMIVGFIFVIILLSFTVDVAVRGVKLAALRLIAPIPIISYMDPKGGKDSAFNTWVKTLTSTYVDLFIRLAVVYFVIFLIQDMIVNGIVINKGTGVIGIMSWIIIWIGLFAFAKQAPKFFRSLFGLKDEGSGLFSGFKEFGAAMGLAAAIPGAIGSARAGYAASKMADETRESFGKKDIFGRDVKANSLFNRGKHIIAGIAGGFAGGTAGAKAALSAKENTFNASLDAMRKRNADILERGNSGSTLLGRLGSTARSLAWGEGVSGPTQREIASLESKQKALQAIEKRVSGEMVKQDWTYGDGGTGFRDTSGNLLDGVRFNHKKFLASIQESQAAGRSYVEAEDEFGIIHNISVKNAEAMKGTILKNNEDCYIQEVVAGHQTDAVLSAYIEDAEMRNAGKIRDRAAYKKGLDQIQIDIAKKQRENTINLKDDSYSNQKRT